MNAAIVGGQFGSEGKGLIAGHIAKEYDKHVRVGAANAGHTLYTNDGVGWDDPMSWDKHVMQQIPCAAYANPDAKLYVGPGALISPEIFSREMAQLGEWRRMRGLPPILIHVDGRAHVIHSEQIGREALSGLERRIGSTSATAREGIGQAQADRVMRDEHCILARDFYADADYWDTVMICEVPHAIGLGGVLLEGTQGTGLSLTTGFFPYTTSRNTTVAGLCADAGFPPTELSRVILVARTYPIRVAGNSGPFYADSTEIGWKNLGIDPSNERTTVTKKVRRVATFSMQQMRDACVLNAPTEIALTFCDYLCPEIAGCSGQWDRLPEGIRTNVLYKLGQLIADIEEETGVPVTMLGTGPHSVIERSA